MIELPAALTGIRLSIGQVQPGWFNIDNRGGIAGVDLVWDLEDIPWPLEDACALEAQAGHVISRINPARWGLLAFFDEVWRVLKPGGEFRITTYYGLSTGYLGDPAACALMTESTFYYLDPEHRSGLWQRYQALPWRLAYLEWDCTMNIEAIIVKR